MVEELKKSKSKSFQKYQVIWKMSGQWALKAVHTQTSYFDIGTISKNKGCNKNKSGEQLQTFVKNVKLTQIDFFLFFTDWAASL